jgi:hypothetical protein
MIGELPVSPGQPCQAVTNRLSYLIRLAQCKAFGWDDRIRSRSYYSILDKSFPTVPKLPNPPFFFFSGMAAFRKVR